MHWIRSEHPIGAFTRYSYTPALEIVLLWNSTYAMNKEQQQNPFVAHMIYAEGDARFAKILYIIIDKKF